jgi:hypothetical protein
MKLTVTPILLALQQAHAPQAGRFGQPHSCRQRRVGKPGIALQLAENSSILAIY